MYIQAWTMIAKTRSLLLWTVWIALIVWCTDGQCTEVFTRFEIATRVCRMPEVLGGSKPDQLSLRGAKAMSVVRHPRVEIM